MNRKDRRAAQKRGGPETSAMAAVLASAFRAHQAGHRSEAERLYRDVLMTEPRNAAALNLLGALAHQSGRSDEGLSLMSQAVAIEPQNADYQYNLGCVLQAAGRIADAIAHLEKTTALKPNYAAAYFELSNAFARAGKHAEAEKNLRRAIALQPGNAELHNNLGLLAMAQGKQDEAMTHWRKALQLQPGLALAHFNVGLAELGNGHFEAAEASLRRALAAKPDYSEATRQLAVSLLAQDKADQAFPLAGEALSKQDTNATRATYSRCLLAIGTYHPDPAFRERLQRAMQEAWLQPHELAPVCASVLKAHPVIGPAILRGAEEWSRATTARQHPVVSETEIAAVNEPLFTAYLEATPNCDIGIERFLTSLRANLLDRAVNGKDAPEWILNACIALARQCFVNEYVFNETASETERAVQLAKLVQYAIGRGATPPPFQVAALAMYRPLYSLADAESLLAHPWPPGVAALLQQQIAEPAEEMELRHSTPRLTEIDTETSVAVQTQYEENPYPRWVKAISTLEPLAIDEVLRRSVWTDNHPALEPIPAPDILIAGCGTGLQAVAAAKLYRNARLLAVDLSATSLAYARRQATLLGTNNVEFAQADILKLDSLDRRFDLIESLGVLHHLADPYAGWRTLLSLLRPGGLMKIALYSEIARRDVVAARDFAAAGNYQPDMDGIRLCRQAVLRLPEGNNARNILAAADFYSTSAFRDLVLHRHEQRMSLPDIQNFIAARHLEFVGFETGDEVRRAFSNRFSDPSARRDLSAWHQFETDNSDTFVAMYVFWVRKPA